MTSLADKLPGPKGCVDHSFGPFAGYHCRGGFDFTLYFEDAILTLPLQCLLLALVPFRLLRLVKADTKVRWGLLQPMKLVRAVKSRR